MLDIKLIRENPDIVREALRKRHMETDVVDEVIALDEKRRAIIQDVESKKAERNVASKEIGKMKDKEAREAKILATRELGEQISTLDEELKGVEEALYSSVAGIPNIPDAIVPLGAVDSLVSRRSLILSLKRTGIWVLNWALSTLKLV